MPLLAVFNDIFCLIIFSDRETPFDYIESTKKEKENPYSKQKNKNLRVKYPKRQYSLLLILHTVFANCTRFPFIIQC